MGKKPDGSRKPASRTSSMVARDARTGELVASPTSKQVIKSASKTHSEALRRLKDR